MSKKRFIDDLSKRRSDYKDPDQAEMALQMLNKLSTDIYSENKRFIFEFIQNADDSSVSGSNEVTFDFLEDCLIVSHKGKVFDESDVASICHAGSSTKTEDPTKTGYKGVGFKSVFGKSKRVSIYSDGYQFRFDKGFHASSILPWQVIPIWTDNKDLPLSAQKSLGALNDSVATIIELKDTKVLQQELKELLADGEILLFLRHVSKITVKRDNVVQSEIMKVITDTQKAYQKIELRFDGRLISEWLLKTFERIPISKETKAALEEDEDAPPKLKKSEYTDLSFAAKLNGGKIIPLSRNESLIFTYLPTKVREYEFPFLVNASFLTNTPREALHEDQVWNKWLFQMTGALLLRWFEDLANSNYRFQTLNLLPSSSSSRISGLKSVFEEALRNGIPKCRFIINTEGNLTTLEKSVWDQTGLSEQRFIDKKNIVAYINEIRSIRLEESAFIHSGFEKVKKLLSYGIVTFELAELDLFFASRHFIENHRINQNFDLICYFKKRSDGDPEEIWFHKLKRMAFVFDESGTLANPSTGICFPTLPSTTELGNIPLMHKDVYELIEKNREIFDWLKKMGVKEPSEVAYVTNVIIPNLENPGFVTEENHIQIISYLLRLFQDRQLTEEMLSQLRGLRIKTKLSDGRFARAHDCFLSDKYNPYTKLESTISGLNYISEDYLTIVPAEHIISVFFKAISVKDRIEIETINWLSIPEVQSITSEGWVNQAKAAARSSGGFGFGNHNIIRDIKLPSFLNQIISNYLFAEQFWKSILSNKGSYKELSAKALFVYGEGRGENKHHTQIDNYFKWFIQNNICIPASTEELVRPQEAFVYTQEAKQLAGKHLPVFNYESPLSTEWKNFLGLKEKLELEHYLYVLESISSKALDQDDIKKTEIKRIGLIYEKIASLLPEFAEDKKEVIRTWAGNNKVLSDRQTFEYPSDLMYINIPGFTGTDSLNLIHFPARSDFNTGNFRELFDLFSVKVIDTFLPKIQASQQDYDLKNRLLRILPYFAKLSEIREGTSFGEEFSRMHEKLSALEIINAEKINLAFTHLDQEILGTDLPIYQSGTDFYYIGDFDDPITKFLVIPQLYRLFGVTGLNEEFRLLLDIDESAIKKWFKSKHIDTDEIERSNEYKLSRVTIKPVIPLKPNRQNTSKSDMSSVNSSKNADSIEVSGISTKKPGQPFTPKIKAAEASFSKVTFYQANETPDISGDSIESMENIDAQSKLDVGRWSEEYVYNFLRKKHKKVLWMNEETESYKPYDMIVTTEEGTEIFIEVKGTPSNHKSIFPISTEEWKLMFEKGENYFIYRVYAAGTEDPPLTIIENPGNEIKKAKILPVPLHLQI